MVRIMDMFFNRFVVAALLLVVACSCKENDDSQKRHKDDLKPVGMPDLTPKAVQATPADPNAVNPPADAQWTIYCQAIAGLNHVELANNLKTQLLKITPMKDWYVIHEDAQSVLYYGFYRAIDATDPKESQRAQTDHRQIQSMTDQSGERLFGHSYFVEITTPDPTAPAEWNLANAGGYWSLQIAAYKDSPKRKQFAVDAVREARAQGLPAYFYHGENTSMVFIGAWPRSAVKEQDESSATSPDPSQPLLVLSQPLPSGAPTEVRDREGNLVHAVAPHLEPLDPSLIEAMQKYPNNVVNGEVHTSRVKDPVSGQEQQIPDPSFLVEIPRKQPSLLDSSPKIDEPQVTAPTQQPAPIGGKLRSLQDQ